jgi:hypothetical protein
MRARSPYRQLPLPLPDPRLAAARAALSAADHASDVTSRRRATGALAAQLAGLAAARGRTPAPKA